MARKSEPASLGPVVGDYRRGVGDDLAAGAVVGVIVAEDEVLDWPTESLVDLGFEPDGRLPVDGVGGDHPLRRHQEDGEVEVVLKAVEVACDVGDRAFGLGVKRAGHEHDRGQARGGADPRYESFHESLQQSWPGGANRSRERADYTRRASWRVPGPSKSPAGARCMRRPVVGVGS